jgi:cytochrome c oxidase cbb3-type subunit III
MSAVHTEPQDENLFHHEYDGIQECDNPAPPWLTRTFLACIIFAAAYFTYYQVLHRGETPQEEFADSWAAYQKDRAVFAASEQVSISEDTLETMASTPSVLAHGREVFLKTCIGCHTDNGRGLVGPNLTDDYQLHGSTRMDVYHTVVGGVLDKGMPAWGESLSFEDVSAVAAYVTTLRGTNVAGGKAPQGAKVGPFPK